MGKKVKKKARSGQRDKRVISSSPKTVSKQSTPGGETVDDVVSVTNERKLCIHVDKEIDLARLSEKIGSAGAVKCEDCREGAADRRATKGRGKQGKKKGSGSVDSKSDSKAIWICLECGHFSCGGVGFPTNPQSHALRHARQTRHQLTVQFDNPHLRWCFTCNMLIPGGKSEENGEQKDSLSDIVKLVKGRPSEGTSVDVEDVWFGGGSVRSEAKLESPLSAGFDGEGGYIVRGLVNLGNTCFFNSVMQNLLALDILRDYLLMLDESIGPLTSALKKMFQETSPETRSRNIINPRSFFGCVCAKAPQFRGYQQHDSHELLRCLLDGLCSEDLNSKRSVNSSQEDRMSSNIGPSFVDTVFGGQLSSTVCCLECGHSSVVYEPFLDLSLPVPTKKPPAKKVQPVSKARKAKLPPRKGGRTKTKINKDADHAPAQSVSNQAIGSASSSQAQFYIPAAKDSVATVDDSTWLDFISPTVSPNEDQVSENNNSTAAQEDPKEQVSQNVAEQTLTSVDEFTWLDYLEPGIGSHSGDMASQDHASVVQGTGEMDSARADVMLQHSSELGPCSSSFPEGSNLKWAPSSGNAWEEEPLQIQSSEVLLLPYKEENATAGEIVRQESEASSSVVGREEDVLGFDGFGDLFNEPEMPAGPAASPMSGDNFHVNEIAASGFPAGNSSGSDADEVDDTESPVSVESCLALFTKPELLSDEHAWHCESCSKTLQDQRTEAKKLHAKAASIIWINGGNAEGQNDTLALSKHFSCNMETNNPRDEKLKSDFQFYTSSGNLVSVNGELDTSSHDDAKLRIDQPKELCQVVSQTEENEDLTSTHPELSNSSGNYKTCSQASLSNHADDLGGVDMPNSMIFNAAKTDLRMSGDKCESEESEGEQDSENVKVKRDATKRMLINKAPQILTIHLKRFTQDARGRLSKLNGHVLFRERIDLRPYMDPRFLERDNYSYRLIGVVEHLGTMRGGHYVAYIRGGKRSGEEVVWYHASDAYVREAALEDVLRAEAYILFYEKI
ncbi:Peptidase C19, ubiquitin carboxyl-terminal hydrolase [Dillenia turbinata]|uniref:ubiquitinyl hydrolase 1 n=1 Tax=Dillenia turbinata TaxID=194707 RepID=A0AAN8YV91_9MAGN